MKKKKLRKFTVVFKVNGVEYDYGCKATDIDDAILRAKVCHYAEESNFPLNTKVSTLEKFVLDLLAADEWETTEVTRN